MMTFDLILKNINLPDGQRGVDIACSGGLITAVEPGIEAEAKEVIDGDGHLVPLSSPKRAVNKYLRTEFSYKNFNFRSIS